MIKKLTLITLLFVSCYSYAQYYNGSQLTFGQNRIQHEERLWSFYRLNNFDIYFYLDGKNLALVTARYANDYLRKLEVEFDYKLPGRVKIIVYNKQSDFQQSNIGYDQGGDYNIGGKTKIIGSKIFVFYEGEREKLEEQIRAGIAELMLQHILYGGDIKDAVKNSTLLSVPDWYKAGLILYLSKKNTIEIENKVKDGILTKQYKKINFLPEDHAAIAGYSLWSYIANQYGESIIPSILYMSENSRNIESGFLFVLGISLKNLLDEWYQYSYDKYAAINIGKDSIPENPLIKRPKKNVVYQNIELSPDRNRVAFTTNKLGQYKVWIYDIENKKKKKVLKHAHQLDRITDYTYPIINWHPSGAFLAIIAERKEDILLITYDIENDKKEQRPLFNFEKILDFSYSDDRKKFVFSAVQNGQTDIFVYNILSNTYEKITNDVFDDIHPCWVNNSKKILFSSNRIKDTLGISDNRSVYATLPSYNYNLFLYDYSKKSDYLKKITDFSKNSAYHPQKFDNQNYIFLGTQSGVLNQYKALYDSTISHIDTAVHYRYFTHITPQSNYATDIIEHSTNAKLGKVAELLYYKRKYWIYTRPLTTLKDNENIQSHASESHEYSSENEKEIRENPSKEDTLTVLPEHFQYFLDSIKNANREIDITDYIFEGEKEYSETTKQEKVPKQATTINVITDTTNQVLSSKYKITSTPKQRNYDRSYIIDYVVNRLDNTYIRNTYQVFTGGPVTFNPGMSGFIKIGASDVMEDYKLTGGILLSFSNLRNNGYFLSFENLKKRLDKQVVFYTQASSGLEEYLLTRTTVNEINSNIKWPFNEVLSIKGSFISSYTKKVFLSTDIQGLTEPTVNYYWSGLKGELIFDNTKSLGLNLYKGTRYKLWYEHYRQLTDFNQNTSVIGADFRKYIQIHRTLIWANRFAISTSWGNQKLIYYLGGVDNWINLSKTPMFDATNETDPDQTYAFQALGSNMRGFSQNIRNGNSFSVLNSELRWPIFKYFIARPIKSEFIANFQLIGFFDIGTAWTGTTPYSENNYLNNETIEQPPYSIIMQTQRDPMVMGYGYGIRSKIFGYFIRLDWAKGIEDSTVGDWRFYLSLNLDF